MRATHRLITLVLVLVLGSATAFSEEIQLKDGSKITGKIVAVQEVTFQVKTAYGEIKVPRSEIVSIQFPENSSKTATGSNQPPGEIKESLDGPHYSNSTAHFQVTVPTGWALAPELRVKEVVAALKAPDQAHFLMVTPEVYAGSLTTYRLLAETQFQGNFDDFKKASETETKLDGRPALRIVQTGTTRGETKVQAAFLVYILQYDDRMVRLTFYTLQPLFDEAVPMFEKIAASYRSTSDKTVAQMGNAPTGGAPDRVMLAKSLQ